MKILVTSGGTKVPIDRVRSITNMSRGTFGAKIARQLLKLDNQAQVVYLGAAEFCTPFSLNINFAKTGLLDTLSQTMKFFRSHLRCRSRYTEATYKTFGEYRATLKKLMLLYQPDVVVLAAAVSDYVVTNYTDGKIRSKDTCQIELENAPKIINLVQRTWCPACQIVGFKLLVDSSDAELVREARRILVNAGCSFIVANDLRDIKDGSHRLLIVSEDEVEEYKTDPDDPEYLAGVVATKTLALCRFESRLNHLTSGRAPGLCRGAGLGCAR